MYIFSKEVVLLTEQAESVLGSKHFSRTFMLVTKDYSSFILELRRLPACVKYLQLPVSSVRLFRKATEWKRARGVEAFSALHTVHLSNFSGGELCALQP